MSNEEIRTQIEYCLSETAARFKGFGARYEYDGKRRRFLVSYSYAESLGACDDFWCAIAEMEDGMQKRFGDNAPLFCEDERLFRLSDNAIAVTAPGSEDFVCRQEPSTEFTLGYEIQTSFVSDNTYFLAA